MDNCEVIAVSGNVGQGTELDGLEEKAIATGASKLYIEDLNKEFVEEYVFPTIKAGAVYEGKYLLGTSFARPVIAKRIVEIAKAEGADAICHGCTGKGNDQVRFELAIKAYAPDMKIIAPWRTWEFKSREEEIEYAEAKNIPLKINRETNYSKDKNLWHLSHEGLDLEDPANEPMYNKEGFLEMGVSPEQAPDVPEYVTISFEKGIPVKLNGEAVGSVICLDKDTLHYKKNLANTFADLVYDGKWYTPLREAMSAFVDSTQEYVTGDVKLKLYKGNIIDAGVTSPYSLYDEEIATFDEDEVYDQNDSAGFINLFGLPIKVRAKKGLIK